MRRWVLSKRDKRRLADNVRKAYGIEIIKRDDNVEIVVENDIRVYLVNNLPALIDVGGEVIPHLRYLLKYGYSWLPAVVVDEGAVRAMLRGADLMKPGILKILRDFHEGSIIAVLEPVKELPVAVHKALYDSIEVKSMSKGKVSRSLHYINDRFWRITEGL